MKAFKSESTVFSDLFCGNVLYHTLISTLYKIVSLSVFSLFALIIFPRDLFVLLLVLNYWCDDVYNILYMINIAGSVVVSIFITYFSN